MYKSKGDRSGNQQKKPDKKTEIVPIDEEALKKVVLDNFHSFCTDKDERQKAKEELEADPESDDKKGAVAPEWNETDVIKNLNKTNGRRPEEIMSCFLGAVFDDLDSEKV